MIAPKDIILFLLGRRRDGTIFNGHFVNAYSQRAEDLIIDGILKGQEKGFYIDIGANHPASLSNTRRFYERGWTGITIEPNPLLYQMHIQDRPKDIALNIGVGKEDGVFDFHILTQHTNSSFKYKDALRNCVIFGDKITETIPILIRRLSDVLEENKVGQIDFMSVDTEGNELEILQSNDWERYSPKVLIIETENDANVVPYLKTLGYELVYSNLCNGIFVNGDL